MGITFDKYHVQTLPFFGCSWCEQAQDNSLLDKRLQPETRYLMEELYYLSCFLYMMSPDNTEEFPGRSCADLTTDLNIGWQLKDCFFILLSYCLSHFLYP